MSVSQSTLERCQGIFGYAISWAPFTTTISITPAPPKDFGVVAVVTNTSVFDPFLTSATVKSANTAELSMNVLNNLPIGEYSGSATIKVCRDVQCTEELPLTGNTIAYAVHVPPPLELFIDGAPAKNGSALVRVGQRTVVTANTPVRWDVEGNDAQVISNTPTRLELSVARPIFSNEFAVRGMPLCNMRGEFAVFRVAT